MPEDKGWSNGNRPRGLLNEIKADFHKQYVPEGMSKRDYDTMAGTVFNIGGLSKVGAIPDAMAKAASFVIGKAKGLLKNTYQKPAVSNIPTTKLYRVDNPNVPFDASKVANGAEQQKMVGQWFLDNPNDLATYADKYAKGSMRNPGMRFSTVEVPTADLPKYNVKNIPAAREMDMEPNNWLIPESIKRTHIPVANPTEFVNPMKNKQYINKILGIL